jgi:homoserine dehydrogenase
VITPNKRATTASLGYYRALREASRAQCAHYLYEPTVGAASAHHVARARENGNEQRYVGRVGSDGNASATLRE